MFDPTKLLPQNQTNVDLLIRQKKEEDPESAEPKSPFSANTPTPDGTSSPTTATAAPEDTQNLNHFSRPKMAGRKVRIVQQDSTQRRQQSALEIVQSEKMYYMMLDAFYKSFVIPLKENSHSFGLEPSNVNSLAETFEKIITFSFNFGNNPRVGSDPADVFEEFYDDIQGLYSVYTNKSIHHIFGLLNDLTGNKRFRQLVKHVQGDLSTNIIEHFLIPTSRFAVYELLLRKYAQFSESDIQSRLLAIADRIKEKTSTMNQVIEELERSGKILNIQLQLSMVGSNVVYLWNPERQLVHEAVTMKSKIDLKDIQTTADFETRTHGENKRRMLLFNDQLMWTTDLPDMRYKGHVSLVDIAVEVFGPTDEIPALLVKQSGSGGNARLSLDGPAPKKPENNKNNNNNNNNNNQNGKNAPLDASKEGWVLIFEEVQLRNVWYREIRSLQAQLANLTTDSTLTIPIEVKDEAQGGCCSIM
jgi:hypothetical protein